MQADRKTSVLILSPNPSVPGGVSAFIECMKRHLTQSEAASFYVGGDGSRKDPILSTLLRLFGGPVRLARLVRRQKFDVVHINPTFDIKGLIRDSLFVLALRAVGFHRIIVTFHGGDQKVQKYIAGNIFLRHLLAWILNQTALVWVLGDHFRDGLIEIRVEASRIAVTRTMFEGCYLTEVKNELPLKRRPFILYMSRFDPEKGGCELVQAFAAVAADYPDMDLVLAGDGDDRKPMHDLVEKLDLQTRVIFTGYVGGTEKWRWLRDCTIFALPTYFRNEGMPVVILEAMGAGKPLVVGAAGAIRSIVAPDNGIILDVISPHNIEAGLRRLLSRPDMAQAMGKHNAEKAWAHFEAAIVTRDIEDTYRKIASC